MNIGGILSAIIAFLFLGLAITFGFKKERAVTLLSGFNSFTKDEQENYDRERIYKDKRNSFFLWGIIFLLGALLCFFINKFFVFLAFIIWGFLFLKDFKIDSSKAFEKYKK